MKPDPQPARFLRGPARFALVAAFAVVVLQMSVCAEASNRKTLASAHTRPVRPPVPLARATAPVAIAAATAPGQTGYVHFFVLRDSESSETQVGIELDDHRIAWSFPDIGVVTTPFIKSGTVEAKGRRYEVQHLYGIRPFPDERSMRELRAQLDGRIAPYIEDETPYCYTRTRGDPLCLSCLDFVARVLFPGHFPDAPVLPRDFERTTTTVAHTTDDLLLYLLGLQGLPTPGARMKRVERLALPDNLREEVLRLVESMDSERAVADRPKRGSTAKPRREIEPAGTTPEQRPVRRRS